VIDNPTNTYKNKGVFMNIKRFVKVISFSSAVVFLTIGIISCATTNTTQAKDNRENPYAFLDTLQLEKGEIFVKDMVPEGGETYSASAFDAANNFLVMDDFFDFTKNLTLDQQIALTKALFKDLPMRKDRGDMRIVLVGDYYSKDSDLIILIDMVGLKPGKIPEKTMGIRYFTNAMNFKVEDKETKKENLVGSGRNLNSNINYNRIGVPFDDGLLVFDNNLTFTPSNVESVKDDLERANLMDTLVKDEFKDNDEMVPALYEVLKSKSELDPIVRLVAEMNYYLYELRSNKLTEAEKTLANLSALVPANAHPSVQYAVTSQAPFLIKLMKAF
jgi:hypothetical protein